MNSQFTHCTGRAGSSHFHCQQVPFLCIIDFESVINTWGPLLPVFPQVQAARGFQDNSVGCESFLHRTRRRGVHWLLDKDLLNEAESGSCSWYHMSQCLGPETPRALRQPCVKQRPVDRSSGMQRRRGKYDAEIPAIVWKTLIARSQIQRPIIWINFN